MKRKVNKIFIISVILLLVSIACQINLGGPQPPAATIPVSNEAAGQAEQIVETAVNNSIESGIISFTLSEEQVTSFLTNELSSRPEPTIHNPQVYLRDNKINVYGQLQIETISADSHLTLSASIDEYDNLNLDLVSVDLGPVPAPSFVLDQLSAIIDEAVTGSLSSATTGIKAETIVINDGFITITGTRY